MQANVAHRGNRWMVVAVMILWIANLLIIHVQLQWTNGASNNSPNLALLCLRSFNHKIVNLFKVTKLGTTSSSIRDINLQAGMEQSGKVLLLVLVELNVRLKNRSRKWTNRINSGRFQCLIQVNAMSVGINRAQQKIVCNSKSISRIVTNHLLDLGTTVKKIYWNSNNSDPHSANNNNNNSLSIDNHILWKFKFNNNNNLINNNHSQIFNELLGCNHGYRVLPNSINANHYQNLVQQSTTSNHHQRSESFENNGAYSNNNQDKPTTKMDNSFTFTMRQQYGSTQQLLNDYHSLYAVVRLKKVEKSQQSEENQESEDYEEEEEEDLEESQQSNQLPTNISNIKLIINYYSKKKKWEESSSSKKLHNKKNQTNSMTIQNNNNNSNTQKFVIHEKGKKKGKKGGGGGKKKKKGGHHKKKKGGGGEDRAEGGGGAGLHLGVIIGMCAIVMTFIIIAFIIFCCLCQPRKETKEKPPPKHLIHAHPNNHHGSGGGGGGGRRRSYKTRKK